MGVATSSIFLLPSNIFRSILPVRTITIIVIMNQQENLAVYFAEMLAKQNATPEEKKIQALIKSALYGDNLITFIDEVSKAFNGSKNVKVDTVKGVTEYF